MFTWIRNIFNKRTLQNEVKKIAAESFTSAYSEYLLSGWTKVISEDDKCFLVQVCFNTNTKPPGRKFYEIDKISKSSQEIEFELASDKYGVRPWR